MGKGLEQTLLQGGHTEGPETYERMLNITNHQRDEHSNHNEIPLHTGQKGHHKQINKQQVLVRLWFSPGNPSVLLVGIQTDATTVESSMECPQKTKNGTAFIPCSPTLVLYSKNPESPVERNYAPQYS